MGKRLQRARAAARGQAKAAANVPVDELRRRIEHLLSAGSARQALEQANALRKLAPGPESDALCARASAARAEELLRQGGAREAEALARLAAERFPDHRAPLLATLRRAAVRAGNLGSILGELAAPSLTPDRRQELEAALAADLTDPALVARSPDLPAEHPLKVEARLIAEALVRATTGPGPADPETLASSSAMSAIPRRSPLAPWKLLVRAIAALYRNDREELAAAAAAIPGESRPARLVPVLTSLLDGRAGSLALGGAARALRMAVAGDRPALREALRRLDRCIHEHRPQEAAEILRSVLPPIRERWPDSVHELEANVFRLWMLNDLPPPPLLGAVQRRFVDPETRRLLALAFEPVSPPAALALWQDYLRAARARVGGSAGGGGGAMSDRDRALILLRMARVFPDDCDFCQEHGVYHDLEDMYDGPDRAGLLEAAHRADPHRETFRARLEHHRGQRGPRAEEIAEEWHRAEPGELEPVLYLLRRASGRGTIRKALRWVEAAETIDRVHPEVRAARFGLYQAGAEKRLREGKLDAAERDLAALEKLPAAQEASRRTYIAALRWALAMQRGGAPSGDLASLLGSEVGADLLRRAVAAELGLDLSAHDRSTAPSAALAQAAPAQAAPALASGLAAYLRVAAAVERPPRVEAGVLDRVERAFAPPEPPRAKRGARREEAPEPTGDPMTLDDADLFALAAGALDAGRPALAFFASGRGLAVEGPLLHRFLLMRGVALERLGRPGDAAGVLRAARFLARRRRDEATEHAALSALRRAARGAGFELELDEDEDGRAAAAGAAEAQAGEIVERERRRRRLPGPEIWPGRGRRHGRRGGLTAIIEELLAGFDALDDPPSRSRRSRSRRDPAAPGTVPSGPARRIGRADPDPQQEALAFLEDEEP